MPDLNNSKLICKICNKESSQYGICNHLKKTHHITDKEYYDTYISTEIKLCQICGKESEFKNISIGYLVCCSKKCRKVLMVQKVKDTKLERYGDSNFNNMEKNSATKEAKHGSKTYNNRNKAKETTKERYGVEFYNQLDSEKERISNNSKLHGVNTDKHKATMLQRYGVEYYNQSIEGKEKFTERNQLGKIGFNSIEYRISIQNKFGVDSNISQSKEIRVKIEETRRKTIYKNIKDSPRFQHINLLFDESEYTNMNAIYKLQCRKCGDIFYQLLVKYGSILPRCYNCYPILYNRSSGETELFEYIKTKIPNLDIITNSRTIIDGCELDIYIPDRNIAFEYNGLYWHNETKVGKSYHVHKTNLCAERGIKLIHIFEDDWINKQSIIKNRIDNILNQNLNKIYARKCFIKNISKQEKDSFLFNFHMKGTDNSRIMLGAYHDDELVAVMTFGSLRPALGQIHQDGCYELIRFCTKYNIIGGASKLLSFFIKKNQPQYLISYADRCWSSLTDNVYEKIGFKFDSITTPNYWYVVNNKKEHRFSWRKNILKDKLKIFNPNLTEYENMQLNGYDRIWDCGNLKYVMNL